jgi:hypothetical protein
MRRGRMFRMVLTSATVGYNLIDFMASNHYLSDTATMINAISSFWCSEQ